jgi:hypothetical protein
LDAANKLFANLPNRMDLDTLERTCTIVARNLNIAVESVDIGFQYNAFLDSLANFRRQTRGSSHPLQHIESANLFFDLQDNFGDCISIDLFLDPKLTVGDLVERLQGEF